MHGSPGFEVRFSSKEIVMEDRIKTLINESLGVSDEVLKAVYQVIDKVTADARRKGIVSATIPIQSDEKEYTVSLLGKEYKVHVLFMYFKTREAYDNYYKHHERRGSFSSEEGRYAAVFVDVIDGKFNERVLWRSLHHELSHLNFLYNRDKDEELSLPSDVYKEAMKRFTYNDDNASKAAQAVYIRGTNEMSAFTHGLYGELSNEATKNPFPNYERVLKNSTVYRIYKNLCDFENDIENGTISNLNEIASVYGLTGYQLKWIVKKAKKRLEEAINRVIARVSGDYEIQKMFECYDYGVEI